MNRRGVLLGAAALAACSAAAEAPAFPMRRGVNLGNALEAPNEGDWGYRIEESHLAAIGGGGFDGVRIPVRWDAHADNLAPYAIDPDFFARVETVVSWALKYKLSVQLNCHHYDALIADPHAQNARYLAIWRQISARFAQAPASVMFEPLNEPNGPYWTGTRLAALQSEALHTIRQGNPTRLIVFGGPNWNSLDGLDDWTPPRDPHVAATFHYYEPHDFTHENAEWLKPNAPHFGRAWGTDRDIAQVHEHMRRAGAWARAHSMALQLGEFGVNRALPVRQRYQWTRTVRDAAESHGLGWCVWDFAGAFPIYDLARQDFIHDLQGALINNPTD